MADDTRPLGEPEMSHSDPRDLDDVALREMLEDPDTRHEAALQLGELGDARVADYLFDVLADDVSTFEERRRAVLAMATIGGSLLHDLLTMLHLAANVSVMAEPALRVTALWRSQQPIEAPVVFRALQRIVEVHPNVWPEVFSALRAVCMEPNSPLRSLALSILGEIGSSDIDAANDIIPWAIQQVNYTDSHPIVTPYIAIDLLVEVGRVSEAKREAVAGYLIDGVVRKNWSYSLENKSVRALAVLAAPFEEMHPGIVSFLLEQLQDDSYYRRAAAVEGLGRLAAAFRSTCESTCEILFDLLSIYEDDSHAPPILIRRLSIALEKLLEAHPEIVSPLLAGNLLDEG